MSEKKENNITEEMERKTKAGDLDTEDDFDLENLRRSQEFSEEEIGSKKIITTIPVRKPSRQTFFRVHPEDDYNMAVMIMELKEENETYIITQNLQGDLLNELRPATLYPLITRQNNLIIYPLKEPKPGESSNNWWESAAKAIKKAKENWIRMSANMDLGGYDIHRATGNLEDPDWPEMEFEKMVEIAFEGNIIKSRDHRVLRKLKGEI